MPVGVTTAIYNDGAGWVVPVAAAVFRRLAAIAIQTNWRMLKVKWNFKTKVRACVLISRVFRGHIARLRVDGSKLNRNQTRQMSYYAQMATIV